MENDKNTYLFEEILKYIRKLSGYNLSLSYTELELLREAVNKGIPTDTIKKLIKDEIKKYPAEKRKKFNLLFLEEKIKTIKKRSIQNDKLTDTDIPEELKNMVEESHTINHIWKNLPEEEKKEIIKTAIEKMKKSFILTNINKKKVLRSIIRNIIKKKYINKKRP